MPDGACLPPFPTLGRDVCRGLYGARGFSGSELEAAIIDGLHRAWAARRDLITEDVAAALAETKPLSQLFPDAINTVRLWAGPMRARLGRTHHGRGARRSSGCKPDDPPRTISDPPRTHPGPGPFRVCGVRRPSKKSSRRTGPGDRRWRQTGVYEKGSTPLLWRRDSSRGTITNA